MSNKKIVFFDIDGTIWDIHNRIPDSTVEAIRTLRRNGHLAFLNSGRTRAYIFANHLLDIGFDGIVSGCGTMVEIRDLVRFYHKIPTQLAIDTVTTLRGYGFKTILEGRYDLYMDESEFRGDPFGDKVYSEMEEGVLPLTKKWGLWEISKISCDTCGNDLEPVRAEIGDDFDFMVHDPRVVEIVPKGFNKGTGIAKVCEILGRKISETVAFGDSANDLDMLDAAGIGVVMGNGSDEAKEHADLVTAGLYEDGIMHGLKKLELI